jgi:hypothetical protein
MTQEEVEFMGYLKGEGCFRMNKCVKRAITLGWKRRALYTCHISIAQREDDCGILRWAKETYGGTLCYQKGHRPNQPNQKPHYVWMMTSCVKIIPLLEKFLLSKLPSNKMEQVRLLLKVCKMKIKCKRQPTGGGWYSEKDMKFIEETHLKLQELKKYKVQ